MSAVSAASATSEPTFVFQGREVTTPVYVRKAVSCTATYAVPTRAARRFIPDDQLVPAEIFPGRSLFSLSIIDYIDNDLGDYNEVSMALFVRPKDEAKRGGYIRNVADFLRSRLGTYIFQLPVNQSFTCEAGCGIWGFPKSVHEIDIERVGTRYQGKLVMDGSHVLTFSVPFGGRTVIPESDFKTYSYLDGELMVDHFTSGAEKVGIHLGGARLTLGNHPLADELRGMGLPKRALMTVWMGHMRGRFEAPFPY